MPPAEPTRQPTGELLVPVAPTSTGYRLAKRGLDIGGALVGLLVTSPVLGIVAVAVKLDSPGPVLFRQIRLGRGGQPFTVLKFRTMHLSADERRHQDHIRELLRTGEAPTEDTTWAPIAADPRVTRIGGFLRARTSTSSRSFERPAREMSLVGPDRRSRTRWPCTSRGSWPGCRWCPA